MNAMTRRVWMSASVAALVAGVLLVTSARPGAQGPTPAAVGQWTTPIGWPIVPVHQIPLRTGGMLVFDGYPPEHGGVSAKVWNPANGQFTAVPTADDIWCSGHTILADGRVFIAGGNDAANPLGIRDANIFDPITRAWTPAASMAYRRWYPTTTTMSDGRVLVLSGSDTCETCYVEVPEVYNPATNAWTQLTGARQKIAMYPFVFVLPDGRMISAGNYEFPDVTRVLDVATQTWTTIDPRVIDAGSAVMYAPGKMMKTGKTANASPPFFPSNGNTWVLDATSGTGTWRQTPPMANPRAYHVLTLLPDGSVLATGGGRTTDPNNEAQAVYPAELWSPDTETWTTLASSAVPRLYHSVAALLPDGRVVIGGGGRYTGPNHFDAEIFSPPYMFKGPRPTVSGVPAAATYGSSFTINTPNSTDIAQVTLLRPGAMTHSFNMDQRFMRLNFTAGSGTLTIQAPDGPNLAPPGFYLLYTINQAGVPSVGQFVQLHAGGTTPTLSVSDATVVEGQSGVVDATFMATLSTPSTETVTVNYATANATATAGSDYVAASGTLTFAPGVTQQPLVVSVIGDTVVEPTETFTVTLSGVTGATLADGTGVGTITNDDVPPDTTAPTVTGRTPAAGATGVAAGTSVVVTFSEAMRATTLTASTVTLRAAGASADVIGTVTVNGATATLTPSAALTATTSYTVTVAGSVTDLSGNPLGTAVTWSFTTAAAGGGTPTGLVAAYGFNEGTGTTTVDGSGNNQAGTVSGATWTASGRFGSALSFDGVNDWVTVADTAALDLTSGMTLEAWVYPTAAGDWQTVLMKEAPSALRYALYGATPNGPAAAYVRTSGDQELLGTAPALNTWTHLAATFGGGSMRLYVNGVQVATRTLSGSMTASAQPLRIGGNSVWGEYFAGRIDEVRVYNRALTAAEVQSDMTTAVGGSTTPLPSLAIDDVAVVESDPPVEGSIQSSALFTVTLSAPSATPVTVTYATANGTATAGSDYTAASGTLTFAPGVTTQAITVAIVGDHAVEPNETFVVTLSAPSGAAIGDASGTGTITNDDQPLPTLSISDVTVAEGNSGVVNATFVVTLAGTFTETVTVSYATADGTATAGSDYAAASGALTFAPGVTQQPVIVSVIGDTLAEPTETFTVALSGVTGATLADGTGVGTITNDDVAPDTTAPTVTGRTPAAGATGVAVGTSVAVTFSEAMRPTSFTTGTMTLRAAGASANVAAAVAANGTTATLTPSAPLAANTAYTATVAASVTDLAGNPLGTAATWSFTTAAAGGGTPAGLIAAYGFNEGTGTTTADGAGGNQSGTIAGATWTTSGRFGSALSFDGINDWVTVADTAALDLTSGMTLEAWIYPTATGDWRTVIMKEAPSALRYALYGATPSGSAAAYVRTTGDQELTGGAALPVNTWSHVAATFGGGSMRLYVNGVQVATRTLSGSMTASAQPLRIGGNSVWGEYFAGRIDEVRIYNRALTAAEVQSDMNRPVVP